MGDLKAYMYNATGKTWHGEIVNGNNRVGFGKYCFGFQGDHRIVFLTVAAACTSILFLGEGITGKGQ